MKKALTLSLLFALAVPGCSAAKRWFGTPVRTQTVMQACQDGLKDLAQIDAMVKQAVTDPDQLAKLQKLHDLVQQALTTCVQTAQDS